MAGAQYLVNRRTFLLQAGAVAALASARMPTAEAARPKYKMGLQLYTVRDPMAKDPIATLKQAAQLGYRDLETFGFDPDHIKYYGFPARELARILEDLQLTTSSGHYDLFRYLNEPLAALQGYVDRCIEGALALDQKYITWPWLDPDSRSLESFEKLADRLNVIGEQIRKAGLALAYHNHDFEFVDHGGGRTGYDIVMRKTDPDLVKLQLDLFWSEHSSPRTARELFELQPGRFVMWHIKDMDEQKRYTELGRGRIDFTKIMPDAALAGLEYYFVEQGDNFAVGPMQSIATSAAYVKKYLE